MKNIMKIQEFISNPVPNVFRFAGAVIPLAIPFRRTIQARRAIPARLAIQARRASEGSAFAKRALFPNREAFQYKPDAQARDVEILGNIRSLALRACICTTSKLVRRACIRPLQTLCLRMSSYNSKYTRFNLLVLTFALSASLFTRASHVAADETKGPPNFVIFIADDLNKEYYGCYGNESTASPTVSRLAKQGMVFDNAFTGQAICATSRSMLYTGKYPLRNGSFMNHTGVYAGTRSVCHYLQAADYDVILCGKSHVKPASAFPWTVTMQAEEPAGDPDMYTRPAMPVDKLNAYFAANNQQNRRSFCVMASSYYPHGEHPEKTSFSADSVELTRFQKDSAKTRQQEARFNQAIKNSDDEFAEMLALLEKHRLTDNTVVIYVSDHGRFGKWSIYDRGLNVPFVIRWPGTVKAGTRTDALVSFADVLPTMLDIAGVSLPEDLDGKSFKPLLQGITDTHQEYVYGVMTNQGIINAHVFPGRMIRSKRYKYIRNYNATEAVNRRDAAAEKHIAFLRMGADQHPDVPEEELYDVSADPAEQNNLAVDPAYLEVKTKLKNQLQQWLVAQDDFLQDDGAMPLLATNKQFRLDVLSHPKCSIDLPAALKNSLDSFKFYKHQPPSR